MSAYPESHRDLLDAPGVVILTTIGNDRFPQTTAIWYLLDDDGMLKLSLNTSRQKTKNLLRDPHVSLFFIDPANPFHTLEIRGIANAEPDADYLLADKLGKKYGGVDVRAQDRPGESRMAVSIDPVKINASPA